MFLKFKIQSNYVMHFAAMSFFHLVCLEPCLFLFYLFIPLAFLECGLAVLKKCPFPLVYFLLRHTRKHMMSVCAILDEQFWTFGQVTSLDLWSREILLPLINQKCGMGSQDGLSCSSTIFPQCGSLSKSYITQGLQNGDFFGRQLYSPLYDQLYKMVIFFKKFYYFCFYFLAFF